MDSWGRVRRLLVASGLASVANSSRSATEVRAALVIGNSAYPAPNELPNAVHDARSIAAAVQTLGFRSRLLVDADRATMASAIQELGREVAGNRGVALLFFAGHGVQERWRNYLLPVDMNVDDARQLTQSAIPVSDILRELGSSQARLRVLVLDACRDNPFGAQLPTHGLADIEAPPGTLIAFATAPGNVALDGTRASKNSPYTSALLQELQRPAQPVQDVFRRVRLRVREQTLGKQVPGISSNLAEDFRLDTGFVPIAALNYEAARGRFEAERIDWDLIKTSQSGADYAAFLRKYPDGFVAEIAQFRLDQLEQPLLAQAPLPQGPTPLASGKWRYRKGDVIEWDVHSNNVFQRRQVNKVTAATAILVEVNDGAILWDQMGGIVRNRFGTKDPAVIFAPAELHIGKRWRSATRGTDDNGMKSIDLWEAHAVAFEEVSVPAGTFRAFRVERRGESRSENGGVPTMMKGTLWIEPEAMQWVRNDLLYTRQGQQVLNESWRLARWHRVPRA